MSQILDGIETNPKILYSPFDGPVSLDPCNLGERRAWCHVLKCCRTEVGSRGSQKNPSNSSLLKLLELTNLDWVACFPGHDISLF